MTMSPPGDKGQRYEISCFGYPFAGQSCIVAWSEYRADAEAAMKLFRTCPGASNPDASTSPRMAITAAREYFILAKEGDKVGFLNA
jgi:hypothetical protein